LCSGARVWLVCADHDRAQRFLLELFQSYPGLCNLKTGIVLLANSQHWISAATANTLLDTLYATQTAFASQAAGEILMLRFALKGDDEPDVQELLGQHLKDTDDEPFLVQCRTGIAYATAELWQEADFRARIQRYLLRLLDSGDDNVVAAAAWVFARRLLKPDAASRELLEHIAARPNLLKQVADNNLGECLVSMLEAAPLIVANVVESLLDAVDDDFFNDTSPRYFLTEHLLTVSLRLQEMAASHQELGAYIFERMLELNTSEARSITLDLDKRTVNSSSYRPTLPSINLPKYPLSSVVQALNSEDAVLP